MKPRPIHRILIANRGEIARRIMRTARDMDIPVVSIFSDTDADAIHVKEATMAYSLGDGSLAETYLNIPGIINIALQSGADAIHPGYGFLSENFRFARACSQHSICFIGPGEESIRLMGDKIESHRIAESLQIPIIPKYIGLPGELTRQAGQLEFPLMVKAAAGGGGKGLRIVKDPAALDEAIRMASREALNYFGDERVYLEKYIEGARHIEIQILADQQGNIVHLFERECSIQRRHQKIMEEAPAAGISHALRSGLTAAAIKIARAIHYHSAGTVEFLVDERDNFYFLEMNTRIQVEHPVTEMITGLDIVREQIRIAEGYPLSPDTGNIKLTGHAIEARIYAEDPMNDYLPSPGRIHYYEEPQIKGVRFETAAATGNEISTDYDPLVAKVIAHGLNRTEAIAKLSEALDRFVILGIHTNQSLLRAITVNDAYIRGNVNTNFINAEKEYFSKQLPAMKKAVNRIELLVAALIPGNFQNDTGQNLSVWQDTGFWRMMPLIQLVVNGETIEVEYHKTGMDSLQVILNEKEYYAKNIAVESGKIFFSLGNRNYRFYFIPESDGFMEIMYAGFYYPIEFKNRPKNRFLEEDPDHFHDRNGHIFSPLHGRIVKINVALDTVIKKGDTLMIIESMKLENRILSPGEAVVRKIHVKEGEQVHPGMVLIHFSHE